MGEKRTSQAIPDDVWNKVIEGAKEENEIHWKGKKIIKESLVHVLFFRQRYESNATCETRLRVDWKISWFISTTLHLRLFIGYHEFSFSSCWR